MCIHPRWRTLAGARVRFPAREPSFQEQSAGGWESMNRTVSRRDFLNIAGSVGGSTAVYRAAMALGLMSQARAERPDIAAIAKPRKVLILGAGISGLTAA